MSPFTHTPRFRERLVESGLTATTRLAAWGTIFATGGLVGLIAWQARPAVERFGFALVYQQSWDASHEEFGLLPAIFGTVVSSVLAVGFATVLGLAAAIFLTQHILPRRLEVFLETTIDLLAAVPSVVYGLWGLYVLIPFIRPACDWLHKHGESIPLFREPLYGVGMLPAALVLGIMILPTIAAVSREALAAVDPRLREAAYGLGATRWQWIWTLLLPSSRRGIGGAIALGYGRAIGETMALTMLIGGAHTISFALFAPANTLTALLVNKFPEAATALDLGVLMYATLVLLSLSFIVQMAGERIIRGGAKRS